MNVLFMSICVVFVSLAVLPQDIDPERKLYDILTSAKALRIEESTEYKSNFPNHQHLSYMVTNCHSIISFAKAIMIKRPLENEIIFSSGSPVVFVYGDSTNVSGKPLLKLELYKRVLCCSLFHEGNLVLSVESIGHLIEWFDHERITLFSLMDLRHEYHLLANSATFMPTEGFTYVRPVLSNHFGQRIEVVGTIARPNTKREQLILHAHRVNGTPVSVTIHLSDKSVNYALRKLIGAEHRFVGYEIVETVGMPDWHPLATRIQTETFDVRPVFVVYGSPFAQSEETGTFDNLVRQKKPAGKNYP